MELHEKLQELRKQKGLTQEELAEILYVSRTAISKWESGRGYPSIESLQAISKFFSVSIDSLLSPNEILTIAEEDQKQANKYFCTLIFGLLDICMVLHLFLPFFAEKEADIIRSVSLLELNGFSPYLRGAYFILTVGTAICGILMLALQNCKNPLWTQSKNKFSLTLSIASVLVFILSLQPYAAVFTFALLAIKAFLLVKKP